MNSPVSSDYKKWLLYSFDNQGFDGHYDLFKAMQGTSTFGKVNVARVADETYVGYTISLSGVDDVLRVTDSQRVDFLKYLAENYFQTTDVDSLKMDRTRLSDASKNLGQVKARSEDFFEAAPFKIKPHPKEVSYFNIKLVVSIIVYLSILGIMVYSVMLDLSMLAYVAMVVVVIGFVALLSGIMKGFMVGIIRGNAIRITSDQFPELFEIIDQQARQLNVAVPDVYIASGSFNAFVTKFARNHILLIFSEVIETALRGDYNVLKYVTAHELCHIKQKHLAKEKYLFPSRLIPFLGLAYSRGCEYTCDRVGYQLSPQGSIEGILVMTTGKEVYSKFNVEQHIQNSLEDEGFWTWFSEKFLTHPHLYKRLIEVKRFSEYT